MSSVHDILQRHWSGISAQNLRYATAPRPRRYAGAVVPAGAAVTSRRTEPGPRVRLASQEEGGQGPEIDLLPMGMQHPASMVGESLSSACLHGSTSAWTSACCDSYSLPSNFFTLNTLRTPVIQSASSLEPDFDHLPASNVHSCVIQTDART